MSRLIQLILAISAAAVLAGCASTDTRTETWMQLEQARQARLDVVAAQCQTDLCLVMVAQEAGRSTPMPQKQYHPAWGIFGSVLQAAVPAYAGVLNTEAWGDVVNGVSSTIANIDGADYSTHIGGDQIGGDRIDDRSVSVGGDQVGGDQRIGDEIGRDYIGGDNRVGDDISDSCVGDQCRNSSSGPIDQSDNSDNSGGGGDDEGGEP